MNTPEELKKLWAARDAEKVSSLPVIDLDDDDDDPVLDSLDEPVIAAKTKIPVTVTVIPAEDCPKYDEIGYELTPREKEAIQESRQLQPAIMKSKPLLSPQVFIRRIKISPPAINLGTYTPSDNTRISKTGNDGKPR